MVMMACVVMLRVLEAACYSYEVQDFRCDWHILGKLGTGRACDKHVLHKTLDSMENH
mgnify:CR=1 FL=1